MKEKKNTDNHIIFLLGYIASIVIIVISIYCNDKAMFKIGVALFVLYSVIGAINSIHEKLDNIIEKLDELKKERDE